MLLFCHIVKRYIMAWVAEVVKTSDQALVVDAKYEQFTRFCQPLLYKLAIASLSASGSRADVASQLLKASDSIASASAPSLPESAEVVEKQDHSIAEQLLDDISRSLILKGADCQESAVKLIRSQLAAAAAEGGQQASPVGVGAPLAPQLPELP